MPKSSTKNKRTAVIFFTPIVKEIRRFFSFLKGISPKVNVIAWLELEFAYSDAKTYAMSLFW